jgi:hypothetical protein
MAPNHSAAETALIRSGPQAEMVLIRSWRLAEMEPNRLPS